MTMCLFQNKTEISFFYRRICCWQKSSILSILHLIIPINQAKNLLLWRIFPNIMFIYCFLFIDYSLLSLYLFITLYSLSHPIAPSHSLSIALSLSLLKFWRCILSGGALFWSGDILADHSPSITSPSLSLVTNTDRFGYFRWYNKDFSVVSLSLPLSLSLKLFCGVGDIILWYGFKLVSILSSIVFLS